MLDYSANKLTGAVVYIINYSFRLGTVPATRLTAIVTPVPTSSSPSSLANFRPLSVILLPRITQKLPIQRCLRTALTMTD